MTTGATTLLGLALPVEGELDGTWGDTVNNGITEYTNIAIAGTLTLVNDGAVTLANTTGDSAASNITSTLTGAGTVTAQFAVIKITGTLTATKVVTGPSYSKTYIVDNTTATYGVTFKAAGQTGVTVVAGEKCTVYYNSATVNADYVKVASSVVDGVSTISFGSTGLTPATATSGAVTVAGTLAVANGGTGVITSTGSGNTVLSTSPTLVTPILGTPQSATLTNATGLPISTGVSGLGANVATFLATPSSANLASAVSDETGTGALVFANSPTLVTPALGTPSALVGTNITGTASGLTAGNVTTNANLTGAVTSTGNATSLGSFTSANLAAALTDETGSGANVFATSPTLVTPALGTPSSGIATNLTGLPLTTGVTGILPVANGGSGTATPALVQGSGVTITGTWPNQTIAATGSGGTITGVTASSPLASSGGTAPNISITSSTGSGAVVLATSPALVTPVLGTPSSGTLTSCTGLPVSTGVSGLGTSVATALAVNVGSAGAVVVNGGVLGTPSSGMLTSCVGLPVSTGVSGLGTSVATALAVNVGSAGAVVVNGGALGTPSSGTLTNCTFPTLNQNTTGSAGSVATTNFSIVESGGKLLFKYGATTIASMDSSGNLTTLANVTAYGTP
jgi:hypothetical protein